MNSTVPKCSCSCNEDAGPPALVYACSGAADTGEIADRAARRLDVENTAWMSCLAGIGGRVSGMMANAGAAPALLAIDGCPLDCAKKTLQLAGFANARHMRVTDLGFKKGKTPATPEAVARVVLRAREMLRSA
ncbi:MAG: zinc-binding protein [Verrucomicrobia bacterium RIFCSPLOWO2_12_FULL_64_8]|nr:MAG: zinc-binding protein [Verrucomicrobia bacterium RIFCSPLOWO2_12_FULL_64_8]